MNYRVIVVLIVLLAGFNSIFSQETTPVEKYGLLSVKGTQIVDKNGDAVQLKGVSLFWSQFGDKYWNYDAVSYIVSNWNVTVIRAAMGIESGGYLSNKEAEMNKVTNVVDIAERLGIYVIIDWHDHHASSHLEAASAFFKEMAILYKNTPNVMFEPYNEPLINETWDSVKAYSEKIVKIIRTEGANNIIIIGSPTWSLDVDSASLDPIKDYDNIAYSLHFYAGFHKQDVREKAEFAMGRGVAIFVTEWGTCNTSGNGGFDPKESDLWTSFMDKYKISWCNWSLNDKDETASIFIPGASTSGGWKDSDLTESGKYIKAKLLGN